MMTRARRILTRAAVLLVIVYLGACGTLYSMQNRLIYPRHMIEPAPPESARPVDIQSVWITAPDGSRVEAWFLPGVGRSPSNPGPAVVLTHGNGELIDHDERTARMYQRWGVSVLQPEYRGYGRSTGSPGQPAITEDLLQFYDWLAARPEVDTARLVYHGRSIGAGYACVLADTHPPRALILNSPFKSMVSMAAGFWIPAFLVGSPLRNDRVLAKDPAPVLIFHGTDDEIIPVSQGKALAKLSPRCTFLELDCGHNDLPPDWAAYQSAIREFLIQTGTLDTTSPPAAASIPGA